MYYKLYKEGGNKMENKNVVFNDVANEWLLFKKSKIKESTYLNYKYLQKSMIKVI